MKATVNSDLPATLIDRHHCTEVEQDLDHLVTFDGHTLRKVRYRDALGNLYFMDYRRGWALEPVF